LSAPLFTSLENRRIRDVVGDDDDDDTGNQSSTKKLINYLLAPLELDAAALSQRPEDSCSFVETEDIFGPDTKLVYKHFATLYFIFVIDSSESELGMLDLIQVFVETLDRCFKNVCELDIVYNFNKVHTILDEIVMGGQVVETNSVEVLKAVQDIWKLERVGDLNVPSVRGIGSYRSKS
jgi:AP-3 complex subunit sigma